MSITTLNEGDVFTYVPTDGHHCREALAIVQKPWEDADRLVVRDTYWSFGGSIDSMVDHLLTEAEEETAEFYFNVNDVTRILPNADDRLAKVEWEKYAREDRFLLTSQHRLRKAFFVKKGAVPSLEMQIENAKRAVDEAEAKVRSAEFWLENRRRELAELESQRQTV